MSGAIKAQAAVRGGATAWWWTTAAIALVLAAIGLLRPNAALAALLIAGVSVAGVAAAYAFRALLRRLRPAPRSAFVPAEFVPPEQRLPHHVARIAPDPNERSPLLTPGARTALVTVATERLWAVHRLNLHDPNHQPEIQSLVPSELWEAIRPDQVDRQGRLLPRPRLLHRNLDLLLDDLEGIT